MHAVLGSLDIIRSKQPQSTPGKSESGSVNLKTNLAHTDAALMTQVELGNAEALTSLFRRYSGLVYAVALRVLKDPAAAEDVSQDIFLQVWRTPGKYRTARGDLASWLAVTSRNRAIDVLRIRRPTDSLEGLSLSAPADLAQEAEQYFMIRRVREGLAKLPDSQRSALELALFSECSHSEIAERLRKPLGTVKTRIRSGMQSLVKTLRPVTS